MLEGIPTGVLQETKMGERGFKKEGVTMYIDELLNKIGKLEEELENHNAEGEKQESQLIQQYRSDLDNAQKKASEAIKQAQESASQLQAANDKAAQLAAALKTEKEERSSDAQKMKQLLQQAQAQTANADEGKIREYQEEILSLKGEITKLKSGKSASEAMSGTVKELEEKLKSSQEEQKKLEEELAEKEEALSGMQNELNDLGGQIFAKDMQIDDLQSQTEELKAKVEELESNSSGGSFIAPEMDMSAIFAEAQKNANQLVVEAKKLADKMTREAEAKSKQAVSDADAKAEKTIKDADEKAKKTTADAEAEAKKTRDSANEESERILKDAEKTLSDAKAEADSILSNAKKQAEADSIRIKSEAVEQEKRVRQLTATLRSMLTLEIDGLEKSVKEASELMSKAASQMNEKLGSVDHVIAEARASVEDTTKLGEEKMDAIMKGEPVSDAVIPKPVSHPEKNDFNQKNPPKPSHSNKPGSATKDDFAQSMMEDFASAPNPENNLKKPPLKDSGPTPMPKKPQKLNFDMTELIKDAEASMSD